jgi:hypothetical protein
VQIKICRSQSCRHCVPEALLMIATPSQSPADLYRRPLTTSPGDRNTTFVERRGNARQHPDTGRL